MNRFKTNIIKAIVCVMLIGISVMSFMAYGLLGWGMLGWEKLTDQVLGIVLSLGWVILFCLIVYIIKKEINKKVVYIIFAYICLLIVPIISIYAEGNYYKTFSKRKWRSNPEARFLMEEDLYEKYDLKSLSKEEIIDLLGGEDEQACNEVRSSFQKNCKRNFIVLWLGRSEFSIKRYMVIIYEGNSVEDVKFIEKRVDPL